MLPCYVLSPFTLCNPKQPCKARAFKRVAVLGPLFYAPVAAYAAVGPSLAAAELRRLLSSRHFQAALKFYLATATTLVATVLLMEYVPAVRSSVPIFGFTTVCLTCQDRVEATVDKVGLHHAGHALEHQFVWSLGW